MEFYGDVKDYMAFYNQVNVFKVNSTIITLVVVTFFATSMLSQKTNTLWYHKIGKEEGLTSQDFNDYVYSDSEGYVWISSTAGLNRFDGRKVKKYHSDPSDSASLYSENIQSRFFEDSRHNLWFSTYDAVHCYVRKSDQFRHYFIKNNNREEIKEDYYVFCLEQDSLLWLRVGKGIYRVNINYPDFESAKPLAKTWHFHCYAGVDYSGAVQYLFAFSDEKRMGVECFVIKDGACTKKFSSFDLATKSSTELGIYQVSYENPENIWLASHEGLVKWSISGGFKKIPYPNRYKGTAYLTRDSSVRFVISLADAGLFIFEKSTKQFRPLVLRPVATADRPVTISTRNIYLDLNRVIWVSVPLRGIFYASLEKRKFNTFSNHNFLPEKKFNYRNFIEEKDGTVWCGYSGGVFLIDRTGRLLKRIDLPVLTKEQVGVFQILKDREGTLWAATNKGLYYCSLGRNSFVPLPGVDSKETICTYQLRDSTILITTLFDGIYALSRIGRKWHMRNIIKSDGIGYTAVYKDRLDQIYICKNETAIQVFVYEGDTLRMTNTLPVRGTINAFAEDSDGRTLWIASASGLVKIDIKHLDQEPVFFLEKDGLPDNNVLSVVPSKSGMIWITTNAGLTSFTPRDTVFRNYSLADGIQSIQFDRSSGLRLQSGEIWFGGAEGITVVDTRSAIKDIRTLAAIVISEIKNNDLVSNTNPCAVTGATSPNQIQRLIYAYKDNTLSFSFNAVDYADPLNTIVKYKLQGVDKTWVTLKKGETGFARYPSLPPGDYTFSIKGTNSDGIWNETPHQLSLTILPPIWQTWWFRALLLLSIFALLLAILQYRINQVRITEQLRRRIAENKMAALIAQMNPHFIFNSLQSINSYILKNNRKLASEYLSRFSKLMRMILENSLQQTHTLDNEMELLDLYLKVEAQRFKEPFRYDISIDESLDPYNTQLPGMMLQPFVENAIWHGISHKEGTGHVQISILNYNGLLKCTIRDNGVGREKAAEIARRRGKPYISRALQILTERLELLFPDQQNQCSIRYIDLFDSENLPAGTEVEIILPAIE